MRSLLVFALIRLALWAVIWWLLTLVGIGVLLAGVLAALLAMLVSFLLLGRQRDAAAEDWRRADERRRERRGGDRDEDADEEDALIDGDGASDAPRAAPDRTDAAGEPRGIVGPADLPEPAGDDEGTEAATGGADRDPEAADGQDGPRRD